MNNEAMAVDTFSVEGVVREQLRSLLEALADNEEEYNTIGTLAEAQRYLSDTAEDLTIFYFEPGHVFDAETLRYEAARLAAVSVRLMEMCHRIDKVKEQQPTDGFCCLVSQKELPTN